MTLPLKILVLETAAVCNLRCNHCVHGLGLLPPRGQPYLDLALLYRVLGQIGQVETCYPALWGEPALHPQLLEILSAIRSHATSVTLTTNGVAVDARLAVGIVRLVDRVVVGIPAATAATYLSICKVDRFDAALHGLQLLAADFQVVERLRRPERQPVRSVKVAHACCAYDVGNKLVPAAVPRVNKWA